MKILIDTESPGNNLNYDISAVPHGMSIYEIFRLYHEVGILLYDSTQGERPMLMIQTLPVEIKDTAPKLENAIFGIPKKRNHGRVGN